jgi:uncharacterized protein (TIGR03437 family)
VPLDLGGPADSAFLVLFGTGIQNRSSPEAVRVAIADLRLPVQYAGAQGSFLGLDQVNVPLPPSLAGRGEVPLVVMVDGKASNTVTVRFR